MYTRLYKPPCWFVGVKPTLLADSEISKFCTPVVANQQATSAWHFVSGLVRFHHEVGFHQKAIRVYIADLLYCHKIEFRIS